MRFRNLQEKLENFLFLFSTFIWYEITRNYEMGEKPGEFDNCLKNLKLKVNFVKEIIIHIWHLLLSQSVFQVQWRHICPLSLNSMIEFEFEKLQIWISVGLYGFQLKKCKISFLYFEESLISNTFVKKIDNKSWYITRLDF